jgi:hypothetical protein
MFRFLKISPQILKNRTLLQLHRTHSLDEQHFFQGKIPLCLQTAMGKTFRINFLLLPAIMLVMGSFRLQLQSFQASYQGSDIRLEWKVSEEAGVTSYEISRKKEGDASYGRLAEVNASGQSAYFWVDDNLYKDGDAMENISYRLTAQTSAGPKYFYASIQHSPTAVQRSWGSIKSMFR